MVDGLPRWGWMLIRYNMVEYMLKEIVFGRVPSHYSLQQKWLPLKVFPTSVKGQRNIKKKKLHIAMRNQVTIYIFKRFKLIQAVKWASRHFPGSRSQHNG